MAHLNLLKKHDDYMTPISAWDNIKHLIPQNKVIWEPFYGDGQSGIDLASLGFNVIHRKEDFFKHNHGDIIVSNPPYTLKREVLERCIVLNKPFIMIMPSSTINTQYVRSMFKDNELQIIIPRRRIQFRKIENGKKTESKSSASFDCFYFCWKINLNSDITWI